MLLPRFRSHWRRRSRFLQRQWVLLAAVCSDISASECVLSYVIPQRWPSFRAEPSIARSLSPRRQSEHARTARAGTATRYFTTMLSSLGKTYHVPLYCRPAVLPFASEEGGGRRGKLWRQYDLLMCSIALPTLSLIHISEPTRPY